MSAKTYLGVTAPFYTEKLQGNCSPYITFEGECYEASEPKTYGYTILFGFLNFGLFYLTDEVAYGADNKIEWQMKNELTGIYFGYDHPYGWNLVSGLGEGKSILTTKEKSIYKNSGETEKINIRTPFNSKG